MQIYHGALPDAIKLKIIKELMSGECRIVICTDAFDMDIDISDIEVMIQLGVSEIISCISSAQRIGRAARDPNLMDVAVIFMSGAFLNNISKNVGPNMDSWKETWMWKSSEKSREINPDGHLFGDDEAAQTISEQIGKRDFR